uniref:Uncharacterized protein n=1 Tax=Solanum tuberosum TaxID=4113 RepID=M1AHB3_SOLTU
MSPLFSFSLALHLKNLRFRKPVYVIGAERCTWKFRDFHRSLKNRGVVRPFLGKEDIFESWSYSPLNDTKEAAAHVITALAERGWGLPS